jgi:predicted O-methyltransferase YrrM
MIHNENEPTKVAIANSLLCPPVSTVLTRLFGLAEQADAPMRRDLAQRSADERAAIFARADSDYRTFYGQVRELFLPVSPETGTLLYVLARASRARSIVEYGTSFGISTIHLAAALQDNGGGRLIGSEFEPGKVSRARENVASAGLSSLVEIREGDALETLARDLPASIDLVLLDGAKVLYPRILALVEPKLRAGAIVIADNADNSPEFLAHVRDPRRGYVSLPFGSDVEVSLRA